jgi:hypothetical protein
MFQDLTLPVISHFLSLKHSRGYAASVTNCPRPAAPLSRNSPSVGLAPMVLGAGKKIIRRLEIRCFWKVKYQHLQHIAR